MDGGTLQVFVLPANLKPVQANVDLKPESLQKRSRGNNVEAHIGGLPDGFSVANIDRTSVHLCRNNCIRAESGRVDGKKFIAVFDRGAVLGLIEDVTPPATVTFRVVGVVQPPGRPFEGTDTVRVVDPPTPTPTPTPTRTPTPTISPGPRLAPTPSPTPVGSPTPTATPSPTASSVPTPSRTPAPTSTAVPSPTVRTSPTAPAATPSPPAR